MSSSEGEEEVKEPVPEHRVRFTDMPQKLVDQAVRSKHSALAPRANLAPASFFVRSLRRRDEEGEAGQRHRDRDPEDDPEGR